MWSAAARVVRPDTPLPCSLPGGRGQATVRGGVSAFDRHIARGRAVADCHHPVVSRYPAWIVGACGGDHGGDAPGGRGRGGSGGSHSGRDAGQSGGADGRNGMARKRGERVRVNGDHGDDPILRAEATHCGNGGRNPRRGVCRGTRERLLCGVCALSGSEAEVPGAPAQGTYMHYG